MTRKAQVLLAVSVAMVLAVTAGLVVSVESASEGRPASSASVSTQLQTAQDILASCELLLATSEGMQKERAQQCVADQQAIIALLIAAGSATSTTVPVPTTAPPPTGSPAPAPTTAPVTTAPPSPPAPNPGWPGAANTGVPDGTTLTSYSGPCLVTTPNTVIDAKIVNCDLSIHTTGVKITRSRVMGTVSNRDDSADSFSITDSEVHAAVDGPRQVTGVAHDNFTMLRVEVTGGNRGVYCRYACEVRDSWIHGTKISGDWHASALRMEQRGRIIHNTLSCDTQPTSPEGSCSADLTGYGDYAPIRDNLIEGNLFVANLTAAFCAYGGSSKGKPYSDQVANIVFRDNVFQRGGPGKSCGLYGAVGDWDGSRPGNQWVNNTFEDGTVIKA